MDFSDEAIHDKSYFSNDTDMEIEQYYSAARDTNNGNAYINHLPADWVFVPDNSNEKELAGYYYYTKPIKPNESTPSLFTYVKTLYDNMDDVKQYDIIVYTESVQTTDSNGEAYTDYEAAWKDFLKTQ